MLFIFENNYSYIFSGLALFIFGASSLTNILKLSVESNLFKRVLNKITKNYFTSFLFGFFFTAFIQSSSATSVIAISLINSGLIDPINALAIIIGANIGTTATGFLIAFNIDKYMPLLLLLFSFIMLITTNKKIKLSAEIVFTFSLFLFGIWLMKCGFNGINLSNFKWFKIIVNNAWLGFLCAMAITMIFQSSSVATGIIQTLGEKLCSRNILSFIFGVNAGAIMTPVLVILNKLSTRAAKRVVLLNIFIKISTALTFMLFFYFIPKVDNVFIKVLKFCGRFGIPTINVFLNVISAIIFLPWIRKLYGVSEKIIKNKTIKNEKEVNICTK